MSRRKKITGRAKITTVIGSGTTVNGNIEFSGGLHVDGAVKGNVIADPQDHDAVLILSEKSTIEGELKAPVIITNGTIIGDVFGSKYLELASESKISGTVYYHKLEMAMGAEVNGKLICAESEEMLRLSYDGDHTEEIIEQEQEQEQEEEGEEEHEEEQEKVRERANKDSKD